MGQKPGTRLANPAQEQPSKMLAVELKMEQPAAQALVYVSFVAMLHTGEREGEQGQSCKEVLTFMIVMLLENYNVDNYIKKILDLFCNSGQEQRRQEAGVSRSEELPQSMKMRERVTRTATRSDTKLYKARERADGLK